jgi:hypothetical protein
MTDGDLSRTRGSVICNDVATLGAATGIPPLHPEPAG